MSNNSSIIAVAQSSHCGTSAARTCYLIICSYDTSNTTLTGNIIPAWSLIVSFFSSPFSSFSVSHSVFLFRSFLSFRLVVFRLILVSASSLLLSLPSLLSLVADSVILLFRLGATPPPRSLRASSMRIPLACYLLSLLRCWCWLIFFFLLFLPIFDFDLAIVCFHPVFFLWVLCCLLGLGFCCDSFSIWYIYMCYICVYLDT